MVKRHLVVRRWPGVEGRLVRERPDERESAGAYRASGGCAAVSGHEVIELARDAGLRGRGGAGFPTWRKLVAVRDSVAGERVVVANGEEGEPTSVKDRYLLRYRPHLILDGLEHAARAVGARRAYVYLSEDPWHATVREALEEEGRELDIRIVRVAAGFVAGEETAVVRAIDDGPAKPTAKPPRPFEHGVGGHPTAVLNVETLAHLALLASHGVDAHRAYGTAESTGTFLATLSSPDAGASLCEVPFGLRLDKVLDWLGLDAVNAFLVGGFSGGLLASHAGEAVLSHEGLHARQCGLGCGAIVALERHACPLEACAEVMTYLAASSARQCGSCVGGTAAMRDVLLGLVTGAGDADALRRLGRWGETLRGRGACGLLDAAAGLARSVVRELADDVARHLRGGCRKSHRLGNGRPSTASFRTRFAIDCFEEVG